MSLQQQHAVQAGFEANALEVQVATPAENFEAAKPRQMLWQVLQEADLWPMLRQLQEIDKSSLMFQLQEIVKSSLMFHETLKALETPSIGYALRQAGFEANTLEVQAAMPAENCEAARLAAQKAFKPWIMRQQALQEAVKPLLMRHETLKSLEPLTTEYPQRQPESVVQHARMDGPRFKATEELRQETAELANLILRAREESNAACEALTAAHFRRPERPKDWIDIARIVEIPEESIGELTLHEILDHALAWVREKRIEAERKRIVAKLEADVIAEAEAAAKAAKPQPTKEFVLWVDTAKCSAADEIAEAATKGSEPSAKARPDPRDKPPTAREPMVLSAEGPPFRRRRERRLS